MKALEDLISNLKDIVNNFNRICEEAIRANEQEILDLNREDQLFEEGINRTGSVVLPEYAFSTVKRKIKKHQPWDHVTLRDTGHFHNSFYIIYHEDGFEIATQDMVKSFLEKYGDEYLGVTDANKNIIAEKYILPALRVKLKNV